MAGTAAATKQIGNARKNQPERPSSTEPINGRLSPGTEDDEATDDASSVNNRDQRSVSATIVDRSRLPASTSSTPVPQPRNSRSIHHHHHHQHTGTHRRSSSQAPPGSSPQSARETFLNYFFGQQNPSSSGSANISVSASETSGIVLSGRDLAQPNAPSGLMGGKRGLDGTDAAYDMKSLGKHIEAVC